MTHLLQNTRLKDNAPLMDVLLEHGRFSAIEPASGALRSVEGVGRRWDLNGRVLLPGLVDAHVHLDKTFSTTENQSGTLGEAIQIWGQEGKQRSEADLRQAVEKALRLALQNGVTAMRSHIDIGGVGELTAVFTLLDIREQMRGKIDLQFVALGQSAGDPKWRAGMEEALKMGVGFVGGAPALCPDYKAEIDAVFDLAEQFDLPIDLHIDETEDPNMLSLEYLADETIRRGFQGRVTAGHCCSLAFVDEETAVRIIDKVAAAQINVITLPSCNLVLMGRNHTPKPRGATRVKELLAAGVNVCAASDNVHDPFNPFGSYDLLHIANLNAHVAHMSGQTELYTSLDMVTQNPAQCLGQPTTKITVGQPADCVIVDAQTVIDTVLAPQHRLATFKAGVLVAETKVERWIAGDEVESF